MKQTNLLRSGLLALFSLTLALGPVLSGSAAPDKAQVRSNLNKLKTNEQEIQQLKRKAEETKRKEQKHKVLLADIQQDLEKASRQLDASNRRYEAAHKEVEELTKQLINAEGDWEDTLDTAQKRMRKLYIYRKYAEVNQLMESENMAALVRRVGYFRYLARQDEQSLNNLTLQKEKLSRLQYQQMLKRQVLGKEAHEQADAKQKHSIEKQRESKYLTQLTKDRMFYEREARALERESRAIADRLQRMYAQQRTSNTYNVQLGTGRFVHPIAGYPMTSRYGYRIHPIFRTSRLHTGQDYGAPAGTPIRAADDGVVIEAGWMGGYGKTVMVNHGKGLATLYAHTSAYYVRPGQVVKKGQVIAAIGSTGNSTGPHLHLEVRRNGSPVDPMGWF